uniref:Elongator complex protein 5 n=1 Tax=Oncorhynchus kisutch TaxID=8019 RepID=A0A8C7HNP8_ONCKI
MLWEVLQGTELTSEHVLLTDYVNYSGRHLKNYINTEGGTVVHVLGFEASEDELKYGLDRTSAQRLHFHNADSDPLSWTGNSQFTVHQFTLEDIGTLFKQTPQAKAVTLIIVSLSWILRHRDPALNCLSHFMPIVLCVCYQEDIFSINEDLPVTIQSKLSHPGYTGMNADKSELVDPTANLTFNLHLSDTEIEAKEKLPLPFDFREEKKSALLHLGLSSGRILYEPDANEDYDPEDPDDDLDF